jgi:hypothetical protein
MRPEDPQARIVERAEIGSESSTQPRCTHQGTVCVRRAGE